MNFYLIGIDYKTVSSEVRELAFKERQQIESFCRETLRGRAAVLFTCNRIEIYGISQTIKDAIDIFDKVNFVFGEIFSKGYFKKNTDETIHHGLRLACGLESHIPFESQIIDQLRSWIKGNSYPRELKDKWSLLLDKAGDIRALMGIDELKKDIADFALEDIQSKIGGLKEKKLLIVGTGKVAELISQKKLDDTFLYFAARKKHSRAQRLARRAGGTLVSFDELPKMFSEADVVISATSSPHYIIEAGPVFRMVKKRSRTLYIYDLASPRDVHPEVSAMDEVHVADMNDLFVLIESYRQSLKPYINKVESLVANLEWIDIKGEYEHKDKSWHKAELVGI